MAKLSYHQEQFIKLINRTALDNDGWRNVSEICCGLFQNHDWPNAIPAELYEFEKMPQGGKVKFTARGDVLKDYI